MYSTSLLPRFALKRVGCNRKCMKGDLCTMCNRLVKLSEVLNKANLRVVIDEEKEEKENG